MEFGAENLCGQLASCAERMYDMKMSSVDAPPRDLEPDLALAAGAANLAHAEMTKLAAEALENESWGGTSPEQWLTYRAGITTSRAKVVLTVAEHRHRFPVVIARFDAGELSLEQVYELVKAPPEADADIEHWGTIATPARIRRSIKRNYGRRDPDEADESADDAGAESNAEGEGSAESASDDRDWVASGITDDHRWRIKGEFDLDSAALITAALMQAREQLWERGQRSISEADCLREVCQRFLDGIDSPLQRDRSKIWLHLDAAEGTAVTAEGVRIPGSVRDKICCDGIIQPVWERDGVPFNLGRVQHIVPERTRRFVKLRDQGCRVPGCNHDRIVEIHHVIHWLNGGLTDTWNLVALCPKHHRMHHQGRLEIAGNADDPDGLVFTDARGRRIEPCGAPIPPTELPRPRNGYTPPPMGRVDWDYVGLGWPDAPSN